MGRTIPSSELENSVEMSHPRSKGNRYFKAVLMQQYSLRFHLNNRLSGEMYQVFLYCENITFLIYHTSHCFLSSRCMKVIAEIVATLCFQYHNGTLLPQSNEQINKTTARRRRRRRRGRTWTLISKAPSNIPLSLLCSTPTAHLKNRRI